MKSQLESSLLFNSLLSGDEIRYSDFLDFIINKYKINPFSGGLFQQSDRIKCYREKHHTDLWITKESGLYEIPYILVENKLKSLAYAKQLKKYSQTFINELFTSVKKNVDEFHKALIGLKFYIISPLGDETIPVKINSPKRKKKNEKREVLDIVWKPISYHQLGKNIDSCIRTNKRQLFTTNPNYELEFINDFAMTLVEFKSLFDQLGFKVTTKLIDLLGVPETFINLNLEVLFKKFRASQCANALKEKLLEEHGRVEIVLGWKQLDFDNNDFLISHSFSVKGKAGLFEVLRKIGKDDFYVIQVEGSQLRKGITTTSTGIKKYSEWLRKPWGKDRLTFNVKTKGKDKGNPYQFKHSTNKKWFYSRCDVSHLELSTLLDLMSKKIRSNPSKNRPPGQKRTKGSVICRVV